VPPCVPIGRRNAHNNQWPVDFTGFLLSLAEREGFSVTLWNSRVRPRGLVGGSDLKRSCIEETVTRRAKTARFSRRSAATFQSRLPPKRGKRSLMGAPPECSTAQMHRVDKRLFLKDFFATVDQWRREWDSNPRYGFPHTRFPSVRLKPLGHLS
jgi:hypothetical protein